MVNIRISRFITFCVSPDGSLFVISSRTEDLGKKLTVIFIG